MLQNKITLETYPTTPEVDIAAVVSEDIAELTSQGVAQSRQLQAKESQLARQQEAIRLRTDDIARGTQALHDQQAALLQQNAELEELVHAHFALREETHEDTRQLLAIADAVRMRRDSLLGQEGDLLAPMSARLDYALDEAAVYDAQLESSVQAEARALALQQTDAAADLLATSRHWEKPIDNAPPDANTLARQGLAQVLADMRQVGQVVAVTRQAGRARIARLQVGLGLFLLGMLGVVGLIGLDR